MSAPTTITPVKAATCALLSLIITVFTASVIGHYTGTPPAGTHIPAVISAAR
jgi:hypothetical protein